MGKVREQTVAYAVRKKSSTSPKESVQQLLKRLKDDITYEEIMYELYVLEKIQKGEQQLDQGKFLTHEQVKKKLI